jgi:hypothetical protein
MLLDRLDSNQVQNTCSYNNITSNYFNSISKFPVEDKLNMESVVAISIKTFSITTITVEHYAF